MPEISGFFSDNFFWITFFRAIFFRDARTSCQEVSFSENLVTKIESYSKDVQKMLIVLNRVLIVNDILIEIVA